MPDTPPEVGSLWLHESGERRFVVAAWHSGIHEGFVVRSHALYEIDGKLRDGTIYENLSDWLAWAANARRIDNA